MKIGLVQMDIIWEDKEANKQKCLQFIKEAKEKNVDMLIFPEMTLTGFSMKVNKIMDKNHQDRNWFAKAAEEYSLFIGFGYVQGGGAKGKNNISLFSKDGVEILNYTKIHPFSHGEENKHYEGGGEIKIAKVKEFNISTFICYDLRFPEIFQAASVCAEAIFIIANWPESRREHWITLLKARAIENQCYIIGVNRTGKGDGVDYCGDSLVVDPSGEIIVHNRGEEKLITADIDLQEVKKVRNSFNIKQDRKNALYSQLLNNPLV
ncbi:MAG: carbon-nitrogen family hydrolase [Bacillota bacterium]|nr:carbon-nitrogen family hydrolase [Bacillota bacterium]